MIAKRNRPASPSSASAASEVGSTIRVISELSQIPMGTLRAWERRYGFPKPARREGSNRRVYDAEQLARLREIARALSCGYRPGDVIHLSLNQLQALLNGEPPTRAAPNGQAIADIPALIEALLRDDAQRIEDELRLAAAALGPQRFVTDVAQPLAVAVGEAWASGKLSVRHEHLMTECLSTQLRALLATQVCAPGSPTVVLATLPEEPHTLGLQMVALYVAVGGARPRLLGASTPPEQIIAAAHAFRARAVGVALTASGDVAAKRRHLRRLTQALPSSVALWIGGADAATFAKISEHVAPLLTWGAIDAALADLRRQPSTRAGAMR